MPGKKKTNKKSSSKSSSKKKSAPKKPANNAESDWGLPREVAEFMDDILESPEALEILQWTGPESRQRKQALLGLTSQPTIAKFFPPQVQAETDEEFEARCALAKNDTERQQMTKRLGESDEDYRKRLKPFGDVSPFELPGRAATDTTLENRHENQELTPKSQ